MNLLPIGQLDGGHIVYAFFSRWHKLLSRVLIVGLVVLGRVADSWIWYAWAVLLLFALRHPVICDESELGRRRKWLGVAALAVLIISFSPAPVREPDRAVPPSSSNQIAKVPGFHRAAAQVNTRPHSQTPLL